MEPPAQPRMWTSLYLAWRPEHVIDTVIRHGQGSPDMGSSPGVAQASVQSLLSKLGSLGSVYFLLMGLIRTRVSCALIVQ